MRPTDYIHNVPVIHTFTHGLLVKNTFLLYLGVLMYLGENEVRVDKIAYYDCDIHLCYAFHVMKCE